MKYSETNVASESKVTQLHPDQIRQHVRVSEDSLLGYVNKKLQEDDYLYKLGLKVGYTRGLVSGLLVGAFAVTMLAIVLLGKV